MSDFVGYPLHGPSMRTLEEWHYDAYHAHSTKGEPLLGIVAERDALRAEVERLRAALRGVVRVADRDTAEFNEARAALEGKP